MSHYTRNRRRVESLCTAIGAGLTAVLLQPAGSSWQRQACAFLAAALPVIAIHERHGQAALDPPRTIE